MGDLLVAALALLALGVLGSAVPLLPGPLLSLAGVLGYWWATGYAAPGPLALAVLLVLGTLALALDYLGGAVAARASGAPTATSLVAGVVGLLLLAVLGPLGMLVGVVGAVFLLELHRHGDAGAGVRTALATAVGTTASAAVQVLLTAAMLVAFLVSVVW
ncbi:MAG: DUF456 domain-containing protein [Haloarculaceae archaeon]